MRPVPIRALEKRLRDGSSFTLDLVPQPGGEYGVGIWSFWMEARINGDVVYERFTSPVRRDASRVADLPHAFKITLLEPNPTFPGSQHYVDRHVGLTDAEADAIDAAKQEWGDRYGRAAIAAAPDAPHWTLHRFPYPMTPGMTTQGAGGEEVMVLGTLREEWTEDGPSFGLGQEEGYLYDLKVRALTSEEEAERARERAALQEVRHACGEAARLFGWSADVGRPLPDDATEVPAAPRVVRRTLFLPRSRILISAEGALYADSLGGGIGGGAVRHPATDERNTVFELLFHASDRGHLSHLPL